jgi:hypothetical protein
LSCEENPRKNDTLYSENSEPTLRTSDTPQTIFWATLCRCFSVYTVDRNDFSLTVQDPTAARDNCGVRQSVGRTWAARHAAPGRARGAYRTCRRGWGREERDAAEPTQPPDSLPIVRIPTTRHFELVEGQRQAECRSRSAAVQSACDAHCRHCRPHGLSQREVGDRSCVRHCRDVRQIAVGRPMHRLMHVASARVIHGHNKIRCRREGDAPPPVGARDLPLWLVRPFTASIARYGSAG